MTAATTKELQRGLNFFTTKYLDGVAPLLLDGRMGAATKKRIRMVKFYLGYRGKLNATPDLPFRSRMWHPKSLLYSTPARIRLGGQRRIEQRRKWKANHKAAKANGVGSFDGVPVANWLIPYLQWAREHGWRGALVSGWRDPVYSESLCFRMCGRPSCSGTCAGRSSNHSGSVKPRGAADVSDYIVFARVIARCPLRPRIFNNLPRDLVHFSSTGN